MISPRRTPPSKEQRNFRLTPSQWNERRFEMDRYDRKQRRWRYVATLLMRRSLAQKIAALLNADARKSTSSGTGAR